MIARTWARGAALAALAIATLAGTAGAQAGGTITGTVVTAGDRRPVQAALVRIVGLHLQDYTHADGGFSLQRVPAGRHRVLVTAIGYKAYTADVVVADGATVRVAAELQESVLQLEEIVSTGTLQARTRSEALSPTSAVAGAALDRQLDGTVAATLRHEPGVTMAGISGATSQPVIRGLSGDRVLVLEDGLRAGDLASTSADHAISIDPLTARSIEVVRGPMSLLYGSSALGGVVNVIRDEIPTTVLDEVHGVVSAQGSSVNRGGAVGGHASFGDGPLAFRLEGTARGAGDTRTPVGRLVNTGLTTIDAAGAVSYIGRRGHAGMSYRFHHADYGIPGGFVGGHEEGVDIAMRRHTVRVSAELHPGGRRWESLVATAGLTAYRHTELEPSGEVGTRFRQTFLTSRLVARHRGLLGAASGAVGLTGQFRFIRTGGELRTPSTADVSVAGFAVQEYGDGPLRLQAGLRYDLAHYEPRGSGSISVGGARIPIRPRTFGSVSGSVGALYEVAKGVRLGASVARAYRTPDFNELYSDGPHLAANSYDVGDPSLRAESGLGVDAFVRAESGRVKAEVAAFRNGLSDYVFPSSRGRAVIGRQGGRPLFQYSNEAARFSGVEGMLSLLLAPQLVLDATASYVAARFTSDRAPIPVIEPPDTTFVPASAYPPLTPPLFGTAELRYERPAWFAGGGVRWAAAQRRVGDFETPTDGYVVGGLHAGVRLLVGGQFHTITLRVDNLTDAEYRDHLSRIKDLMPQPGRNVSVLYRVAF
jgi:iron complex outermembrane recepter protein